MYETFLGYLGDFPKSRRRKDTARKVALTQAVNSLADFKYGTWCDARSKLLCGPLVRITVECILHKAIERKAGFALH